jgi:hypothetical protein
MRRRPLGRHAERDRELADIGGKAGAAARIGTWAFKKRRTRSIVRCCSASGSFHGDTVISAFGASEATAIEVCSGGSGTSSGSTSIGVRQFRMTSRDTLYRKSGGTAYRLCR